MPQISLLFPVFLILATVAGFIAPDIFIPYRAIAVPLLGLIMFCVGLTLTIAELQQAFSRPKVLGLGVGLQFTVMPLAALAIGQGLSLSTDLNLGLILVGCSSGGVMSNFVSYLAQADVALSVACTLLSTLIGVVGTPLLVWLLAGHTVPIAVGGLAITVLKVVLMPISVGMVLNTYFHVQLRRGQVSFKVMTMIAAAVGLAIVVALNQTQLVETGLVLMVAVVLHNLVGLVFGYWIPYCMGYDRVTCRTLSIEVGMQNSGLSIALALQHFSALAALPGAIFSVWHNLSGALLAGWWGPQRISSER
jgi:BASS family bile acid:Na+ symporter